MHSNENNYSILIAILGLLFSIYAIICLYLESSFVWLVFAFSAFLNTLRIIYGYDSILKFLNLKKKSKFTGYLFNILSFSFFISSTYGLVKIFDSLAITDKSSFLLLIISLIIVFAGTSIGLYKKNTNI